MYDITDLKSAYKWFGWPYISSLHRHLKSLAFLLLSILNHGRGGRSPTFWQANERN